MTLNEYYKRLRQLPRPLTPAEKFIQDIMKLTGKTEKTVTQWIYGIQQPSEGDRDLISRHLGISQSELFPTNRHKIWKNKN